MLDLDAGWRIRFRAAFLNGFNQHPTSKIRFSEKNLRVGVFTALLAQMPLEAVIAKLKGLGIGAVELGTGNYPGDPHCKLSLLEDKAARKEFKQRLDDNGITISALSCHGNPQHPDSAHA